MKVEIIQYWADIGIIASYFAVMVFAATNALLARKISVQRNTFAGIASIFAFYMTNYALVFIGAPQWIIAYEHVFVAIAGTVAAITLNPFSYRKYIDSLQAQILAAALSRALATSSNFPRAVMHWKSYDEAIVLWIGEALRDWLNEEGHAKRSDAVVGANWYKLLDGKKTWRDKDRAMAFGQTYEAKVEEWRTKDGKIKVFEWNGGSISGEGLPEHCYYIEFNDPERHLIKIDSLFRENTELKSQNQSLKYDLKVEKKKTKKLTTKLDELLVKKAKEAREEMVKEAKKEEHDD